MIPVEPEKKEEEQTWRPDPTAVAIEDTINEATIAIRRTAKAIRCIENMDYNRRAGIIDGLHMAQAILKEMLDEQN